MSNKHHFKTQEELAELFRADITTGVGTEEIAIPGYVEARRPAAVDVLVFHAVDLAFRADTEVMVHEIVAQFAAIISKDIRKPVRSAGEHNEG